MATLYDTLGVAKGASQDEIKKAYRKLARQHHPDANPGDATAEDKFKEVQNAYDVLSDAEKRKQYDAFGSNGRPGPGGQNFNFDAGDLGDLFGNLFGGGGFGGRAQRTRPQPRKGADLASGRRGEDPGRGDRGLPHLQRLGRPAGDLAGDLPAVQRPRRHLREPGLLRALAAVPALPWQRHRDREAVRHLPRLRA
jgi:curved DNA-binding protein CbpA